MKKFVKGQVFNIIVKSTRQAKDILTLKFDDGRREDKLLDLLASDIFNPFLSIIFCKTNDEVKQLFVVMFLLHCNLYR